MLSLYLYYILNVFNKDINNHKQNTLNYFVGFFPVKLPIVMVVVMLDRRIYN